MFAPRIPSGKQEIVNAFLEIEQSSPRWFYIATDLRNIPTVSNIMQVGTLSSPRIESVLTNSSVTDMSDVKVIVLVHNGKEDVIAASSTIVPVISAQGQAIATFTWNYAFSDVPASIEVIPIVSLP